MQVIPLFYLRNPNKHIYLMKYLFLTIFFLASFAVIACGQIVFPSPNQVEMQKGYLTLRKKISIYAEELRSLTLRLHSPLVELP